MNYFVKIYLIAGIIMTNLSIITGLVIITSNINESVDMISPIVFGIFGLIMWILFLKNYKLDKQEKLR